MSIKSLTPAHGVRYLAGTLSGDAESASLLCYSMHNPQRGEAAVVLWEMGIPAPAYRAFLLNAWDHDHQHVIRAAKGDRYTLSAMFDHAEFDTSALPDRLTVWRGTAGLADVAAAASGLSWTTSRRTACWFAMRSADRLGHPLVIRREIYREEVALYTNDRGESEVVIFEPPEDALEVDGTPDEWRERQAEEEAAIRAHALQVIREVQS